MNYKEIMDQVKWALEMAQEHHEDYKDGSRDRYKEIKKLFEVLRKTYYQSIKRSWHAGAEISGTIQQYQNIIESGLRDFELVLNKFQEELLEYEKRNFEGEQS